MTNADLIVCRNVLLYMNPMQRSDVLLTLKAALVSDGELVLNSGENGYLPPRPEPMLPGIKLPVAATHPTEEEPVRKARTAADGARWSEAHYWLDEAESQNLLNLPTHFLRALVYEAEGRTPDAIRSLRRCLYLDHNFALAHFTLGNLLARSGEREQATQYWMNAMTLLEAHPNVDLADGLTAEDVLVVIRNQLAEQVS